jgi:hypothetical protein
LDDLPGDLLWYLLPDCKRNLKFKLECFGEVGKGIAYLILKVRRRFGVDA